MATLDLFNHEDGFATARLAEQGNPLNWVLIDARILLRARGRGVKSCISSIVPSNRK